MPVLGRISANRIGPHVLSIGSAGARRPKRPLTLLFATSSPLMSLTMKDCSGVAVAPKRARTILDPERPNRPSRLVGPAIRSAHLDSLLTRANKCLDLAAQRQYFIARRFAEVSVVARLALLKSTG